MNMNQFTQKTVAALQRAQSLAIEYQHMQVEQEHLMLALTEDESELIPQLLAKCGVSVSELEMAQNAERIYWTEEEVDARMHQIMKGIYDNSVKAAERYGLGYDLVAGANITGFEKVAEAMMAQGIF